MMGSEKEVRDAGIGDNTGSIDDELTIMKESGAGGGSAIDDGNREGGARCKGMSTSKKKNKMLIMEISDGDIRIRGSKVKSVVGF
ncbi:uncharacterized protein LOC141608792 isoform X2 [Silene latifolia]|uniref:uncharacterized protein LOC141608792 isoform X2 n=1 Tax=Silene latifolia TaxID=37657 RepID=UPI003D76F674